MTILEAAEIIGIVSFAFSGFMIALSEKLDLLGIFIAAFLTALGGGVIRDILVDRAPYAFHSNLASLLVIMTIIAAILFKLQRFREIEKNLFFIMIDTVGLVSFAISGSMIAIEAEFNFFGVALLAMITAAGGGVMRDILINKIPIILTSEFYGTVAFFIGVLIYVLDFMQMLSFFYISLVFILGIVLRLVAYYRNWHLPKII